jgi:hypothetical protein
MHAHGAAVLPFHASAENPAPPPRNQPVYCSHRMQAHHAFAAPPSTSTVPPGAGSTEASPHSKVLMHGQFALINESPDLSPAACVLQGDGNNMNALQALHGSSVLQQSCGEWFGSRSSGSGSRRGNPGYLQFSGGSGAQLQMHALDACQDHKASQAQRAAASQWATATRAALANHHAVHAVSSDVDQEHPISPEPTCLHTMPQQLADRRGPAALQPRHSTYHSTPHASDMEHSTVPLIKRQGPLRTGATADCSAASLGTFRQLHVKDRADDASHSGGTNNNSVHSGSSSQAAILDTIADMRRTLEEDLGASPTQPLSQHYQLASQASHQRQGLEAINTVVLHQELHFHAFKHRHAPGACVISRPIIDVGALEQSSRLDNGSFSGLKDSSTAQSASCSAELLQSPSYQQTVRQSAHMLGRCQGTAHFTPSPHPKQQQKQNPTALEHTFQVNPMAQGMLNSIFSTVQCL